MLLSTTVVVVDSSIGTASADSNEDYRYIITNDGTEVEITRYIGAGGDITIPSTIGGLPVTRIGYEAFYGNQAITSVIIPDSVTSIGTRAFSWTFKCTSVTIGNGVTYIGASAFERIGLHSIIIPDNVITIDACAFQGNGLLYAVIGDGVTSINANAFQSNLWMTSVTIGRNVTSIGSRAFSNCISLIEIIFNGDAPIVESDWIGWCNLYFVEGASGFTTPTWNMRPCSTLPSTPSMPRALGANPEMPVELKWTAPSYSGDSPIDHYTVYVNGTQIATSTSCSLTITEGLTSGNSYDFTVAAHNANGAGRNSSALTITPYLVTLELTITSPSPGAYLHSTDVTLQWSLVASHDVANTWICTDGDTWVAVTGTSHVLNDLGEGPYTVYVCIEDTLGHTKVASVSFTVDMSEPWLRITSPETGSYNNTGSVNVAWATNVDVVRSEFSTDRSSWITATGMSSVLNGLDDGTHVVYVRTIDAEDKVMESSSSFVVDTTTPRIVAKTPVGSEISTKAKVVISFDEAMDTGLTVITISGVAGATTWSENTATFTPSTRLTGNSEYTITVSGKDLAGNALSTTTWSFGTASVGSIFGSVTDTNNHPASHVSMTLSSASLSSTFSTTADANGKYAFDDIAVGQYSLTVTRDGKVVGSENATMTTANIESGGITLNLVIPESTSSNLPIMTIVLIMATVAVIAVIAVVVMRRKK